ncbi:hypothetical protein QBC45DRAFT_416679 [Copromyces sp. CBS 386.78]|nr:hypothetical protein QBC45DRAFT_416679 [Copromyces sp. CBS 386.78]
MQVCKQDTTFSSLSLPCSILASLLCVTPLTLTLTHPSSPRHPITCRCNNRSSSSAAVGEGGLRGIAGIFIMSQVPWSK